MKQSMRKLKRNHTAKLNEKDNEDVDEERESLISADHPFDTKKKSVSANEQNKNKTEKKKDH